MCRLFIRRSERALLNHCRYNPLQRLECGRVVEDLSDVIFEEAQVVVIENRGSSGWSGANEIWKFVTIGRWVA